MFLQLPEEIENKIWQLTHEMNNIFLMKNLKHYFQERAPYYTVEYPIDECIEILTVRKLNYFYFHTSKYLEYGRLNPDFGRVNRPYERKTHVIVYKFLKSLKTKYVRKDTVVKMLKENGVDVSKIPKYKSIKQLKTMLIKS